MRARLYIVWTPAAFIVGVVLFALLPAEQAARSVKHSVPRADSPPVAPVQLETPAASQADGATPRGSSLPPTPEQQILGGARPVSVSPFQISAEARRYFRGRLEGEDLDLSEVWQQLGLDPDRMVAPCPYEAPKLIEEELDQEPGAEVVVCLWSDFAEDLARFLVFSRNTDLGHSAHEWVFRGCVQHGFNRYRMATAETVSAGNRKWLVITAQDGSGTGFAHYFDSWYELRAEGLRLVSTYPSSGVLAPGYGERYALIRRFDSDIIAAPDAADPLTVAIEFTTKYSGVEQETQREISVLTERRRAYLRYDESLEGFVFDERRSEIPEAKLRSVYDLESLVPFDFVAINADKLRQLVASSRPAHREIIRLWLGEAEASPLREELLRTAGQNEPAP